MKKIVLITCLLVSMGFSSPSMAVWSKSSAQWGYFGRDKAGGDYGDFIIDGGLGKTKSHGTHGDEWAVVGLMARQIVEHGGYFCPYQLQCNNRRKKKYTNSIFFHPNGYSESKCAWLCESDYSGPNCLKNTATPTMCAKEAPYTKFASGISLKTWGGDDDMIESELTCIDEWGSDPEKTVMVGVIKYMDHGVVAAPLQFNCGRDNWKEVDSFVQSIGVAGDKKVLCAEGYKANADQSDCEPINADVCMLQDMTMCDNFPKEKYDSTIHRLETSGSCVKYFCSEAGKAFPSVGDVTCADCADGIKGGPHPTNGVCTSCETGKYFDTATGECKNANTYVKNDIQYGKGETANTSKDIKDQCWTIGELPLIRLCVNMGKSFKYDEQAEKLEQANNN